MSALTSLHQEQDPSYYLDNSPSSKKKKGRHRKLDTLTYETIREYFVYTQSQAAKKLGVSVSTLKRKFYSLGYENRWPYIRTVTPKKKGTTTVKKTLDDEEVSDDEEEEEEEEYESEEEISEPITRSRKAAEVDHQASSSSKKRKITQEEPIRISSPKQQEQQISPVSRRSVGFTSSAFNPQQQTTTVENKPKQVIEEEEEEYNEEPIAEEVEQAPIIVRQQKEMFNDHLNNSNISFSDMSHYSHTVDRHSNRLFNEQSQTSNQSQDFGDDILAASVLFQFASDKKKFSPPTINNRILPSIASLHSTNFMNYHAQPLKKRLPSFGDFRNFNKSYHNHSTTNDSSCVANEGLILPPIKNLIRDEVVSSSSGDTIGFNNHHMIQQDIS